MVENVKVMERENPRMMPKERARKVKLIIGKNHVSTSTVKKVADSVKCAKVFTGC
jgi:hypothetical protein